MKDSSITFRISEADKAQLMLMALNKDVPVSQVIREIIREALRKQVENGG